MRDEQQGSYDSALDFPDAEVESKSHQALNGGDVDSKYRAPGALEMSDFSDEAVDVEGATRAETAANAVDAVAAAIHSGNGDAGIARLRQFRAFRSHRSLWRGVRSGGRLHADLGQGTET